MDALRYQLSNNFERAVFLKGDGILPRESARYRWAAGKICNGDRVLEVGCSTGYGAQLLPDVYYTGIDYDKTIIDVAIAQEWTDKCNFIHADINEIDLDYYDVIIAFEVIEHLENGLAIVEKLKKHCRELLVSVPHNEPVGFWGEHHKLHGLNESHLPADNYAYINERGFISDELDALSETNRCNLMLCSL